MRFLPILLLFVFTSLAYGQPVINGAYHGSVRTRGVLNYDYVTTPTVNITEGANQNWVFTIPAAPNTANMTGVAYTTPPPGPYTRNCNFSYNLLGTDLDSKLYIQQNSSGVNILQMVVASGSDFFISSWFTPELALPFNLGFNQSTPSRTISRVDSFTVAGFPANYIRETDTIRYAGYGTCTINGQRISNVIYLRRRLSRRESATRTGTYALRSLTQEDLLFAPGLGYPLLVKTTMRFPAPDVEVSYMGSVVTANQPSLPLANLDIFPNPAHSKATVGLQGSGTISVLDMLGRRVAELPYTEGVVDLSSMLPSFYQVQTVATGKLYRAKLTVE